MKKNIEIIVLLFIVFFIFVTLVIFYEEKMLNYYDNSNEELIVNIKVADVIDNKVVVIDGKYKNYIELDSIVFEDGKSYEVTFKTNEEKIEKDNITKLFQTYEVIKIKE